MLQPLLLLNINNLCLSGCIRAAAQRDRLQGLAALRRRLDPDPASLSRGSAREGFAPFSYQIAGVEPGAHGMTEALKLLSGSF